MPKLLPCPFCGSSAHITEEDRRFFAGCDTCFCAVGEAYDGCAMPNHCFYEAEQAAEAWNARHPVGQQPERGK
jgi:hypothetical protein